MGGRLPELRAPEALVTGRGLSMGVEVEPTTAGTIAALRTRERGVTLVIL